MNRKYTRKLSSLLAMMIIVAGMVGFSSQVAQADIISDISNLTTDVGNFFSNAFGEINGLFSKINNLFSDIANLSINIDNNFNGVFNSINGLVSDIGTGFLDLDNDLSDLSSDFTGGFSNAFSFIQDLGNDFLGQVDDLARSVAGGFNTIFSVFQDQVDDLTDEFETLGADVGIEIGSLGQEVQNLGSIMNEGFGSLDQDMASQFLQVDGMLGGAFGDNLAALERTSSSLANLLSDPDKLADIFAGLVELQLIMAEMSVESQAGLQEARINQFVTTMEVMPDILRALPALTQLTAEKPEIMAQIVEFARNLPATLEALPEQLESKLDAIEATLTEDITQIIGFIPVLEGVNSVLEASDRELADVLANLTSLLDAINGNFETLSEMLAQNQTATAMSINPNGTSAEDLQEKHFLLSQELEALQQENQRLLQQKKMAALNLLLTEDNEVMRTQLQQLLQATNGLNTEIHEEAQQ